MTILHLPAGSEITLMGEHPLTIRATSPIQPQLPAVPDTVITFDDVERDGTIVYRLNGGMANTIRKGDSLTLKWPSGTAQA